MNVLLSSAGNKVPLLRALKGAVKRVRSSGIVTAGDMNSNVLTQHFCDVFWQMPATVDENTHKIIAMLKARNITHVLPTRDGELLFWAGLKQTLKEENIHVIISPPSSVKCCLDKLLFSQHDSQTIIPTYCTLPEEISDSVDTRFVVKERFGAGSDSVGINLTRDNALKHAKSLNSPVYQPYTKGLEISVDAWLSEKHTVKASMCRVRELVVNGESQVTYTVPNSPFVSKINKILSSLKLSGPVVLQAIIKDDSLHVIECNSRFGGASTLGIKAGVDSLFWSLCESLGQDVETIPVNLANNKIAQVRAATDHYL